MFSTRVLPHDEWERVRHTEVGPALDTFDPEKTEIIVVEDGDKIVATWTKMRIYHCECVWVDPDYREKPSVVRALWRGMKSRLAAEGTKVAWTTALSDDIARMVRRSVPIPGRHFLLSFARGF